MKLKDMTLLELKKMCKKRKSCKSCPMFFVCSNLDGHYSGVEHWDLEKEVD